MFAIDALFGLPRKKVSHRSPLFNDLFFLDQFRVDQFVSESQKPVVLATVRSIYSILITVVTKCIVYVPGLQ